MPWSRRFEDPVPGCKTLKDAAQYILSLPKSEQSKPHWIAAGEAVIMAAEGRGPLMHAEIGIRRAMNFGKPEPEMVRGNRVKKYRVIG